MSSIPTFEQIDQERAAAGFTRKQLYEAARVDKETWRRTATGRTTPNLTTLRKLAAGLDRLKQQGKVA